jgi:hypothetical protein
MIRALSSILFAATLAAQDQPVDQQRSLLERVEQLEQRLAGLEAQNARLEKALAQKNQGEPAQNAIATTPSQSPGTPSSSTSSTSVLGGTTINGLFDGYYGYNFNEPIGRANLLRAYDVSSNSFSISQADLVVENAPNIDQGKRWGARIDLQFGQATQTLQGSSTNELRPDIYRNIFQVYGTYIVPIGSGLTLDFGKFASSLGLEGNYTQDQINYSRSFLFDYLPFYHTGLRANYHFNSVVAVNYWAVNGAEQTEADNGFKDSFFNVVVTPNKNITWNVNYYLGQEHPDVTFYPNGVPPGAPSNLPELQGVAFQPIVDPATGKLHIFDSYITWQAAPKLLLALEGDYVLQRNYSNSSPQHVSAGAAYAQYHFNQKAAIAARAEYLSDRGGLYTGVDQALKEITLTWEYKFAQGFMVRDEFRRDFSNQPYFLTNTLGLLKPSQTTATMGLIFWFGGKQGTW